MKHNYKIGGTIINNNNNRNSKKAERKIKNNKATKKAREAVKITRKRHPENPLMHGKDDHHEMTEYLKANKDRYPKDFYTAYDIHQPWKLNSNSAQIRPIFFIDHDPLENIESRRSLHESLIKENDRRKVTDQGLRQYNIPLEISNMINEYAAPKSYNVKRDLYGPVDVSVDRISLRPIPDDTHPGGKRKTRIKRKTRVKRKYTIKRNKKNNNKK